MNTPYNEYSAGDVAEILKVDRSTITYWCRKGLIIAKSVSDGAKNARWVIPEKEVEYLRQLGKQYGSKGIMKHYERVGEEITPAVAVPTIKDDTPTTEIKKEAAPKKFDIDEIALQIAQIQDIKEELNNLDARKTQLLNELEAIRKDIQPYL